MARQSQVLEVSNTLDFTEEQEEIQRNTMITTAAEVDSLTDVVELRRLLKEKLQEEAERGEEEDEVLLKKVPPVIDKCEEYYAVKKIKSATALTDKQEASYIKQETQDDQENYKKELQSLVLKTLSQEELKNPSTGRVLKFVDKQLRNLSEEKLLEVEAAQVLVEEGEGHDQGRGGCQGRRGEEKAV